MHMDVVLHNKNAGQINLLHKSPYRPNRLTKSLTWRLGAATLFAMVLWALWVSRVKREPGETLARISHNLRAPWLDLCPIMPFSILGDTSCIACGLKSPAGTKRSSSAKRDSADTRVLGAIIARSCEKYGPDVKAGAAPATVSGEFPACSRSGSPKGGSAKRLPLAAAPNHQRAAIRLGRQAGTRKPASQETCHRRCVRSAIPSGVPWERGMRRPFD